MSNEKFKAVLKKVYADELERTVISLIKNKYNKGENNLEPELRKACKANPVIALLDRQVQQQ